MDAPVPRMTPGCVRRAMHAIAWELSERYPGIEVAVHDERRALTPGARRLPVVPPLYERQPRGYARELRPGHGRRNLDAVDEQA